MNEPTICPNCGKSQGWNGHPYAACGKPSPFETEAEREEREAVQSGNWTAPDEGLTMEQIREIEELEAEYARANSRCCSDPLCPCPKY